MRRSALPLLALVVLVPLLLAPVPAAADAGARTTTTKASCTDGGGHRWSLRATWGGVYTDRGTRRVSMRSVRLTTKAKVTRVDYVVRVVSGSGATVQELRREDRKFAFKKGKRFLGVDPKNPPSAPGSARVVVKVGDARDGKPSCSVTFRQPGKPATPAPPPATTPPPAPTTGSWPSSPPARVCGNAALLDGPATPPAGAVVVPAGDNSSVDLRRARTTYWFAPGVHTLGTGRYDQVVPGDGATFVGGPGAVLDGQGKNAYAFTQRARDVTISHLTVRGFVAPMNEGTVNHDSGEGWTITRSTITGNGGAGVFLGSRNTLSDSCLSFNGQYGFQGYSARGPRGIVLDHNEVVGNNTGDWERKVPGCGCTGGGKFWDARDVRVTRNYVHDNASVGLWADTNDNNFLISGNWISDNAGQAIFWEISYNVAIRDNVIRHNLTATGPERVRAGDNFPDAAIYVSESGGDARLPYDLVGSPTVDISGNLVEDNYNGVTLWENSDRFCGSPANTSSGYCTLGDPAVANLSTCRAGTIEREPYLSGCRWQTRDVRVHGNTFRMDRSRFGGCPPSLCGRNAVLANYGSYPSWSPYQGDGIGRAMLASRGNVFSGNTYEGGWNVTAGDAATLVTPRAWQSSPYRQDAGSTFR